jgi:NADH:ubiquinone oxidoreductase subunit D
LRAAGVDYDVRVAHPYSSYEDFDFIVPVGKSGDTYDRFCVRNAEVWESISIIKQALAKMPEGVPRRRSRLLFASKRRRLHNDGIADLSL